MSLNPFNPVHAHIQELLNLSSKAFNDDDLILVKNETPEDPLQGIYSVKVTKDQLVVEHYDRWIVKIPLKWITNSSCTPGSTVGLLINDKELGEYWIHFDLFDLKKCSKTTHGFMIRSSETLETEQGNYRLISEIKAVTNKRRLYITTDGDKPRIYPISLNGKQKLVLVDHNGISSSCLAVHPITRNYKDNHEDFKNLMQYFMHHSSKNLEVHIEMVGIESTIEAKIVSAELDTVKTNFTLDDTHGRVVLKIYYKDLVRNARILGTEPGKMTFAFELKNGMRFKIN